MNRKELKFALSNSSARTFALRMTWIDMLMSLLLVGVAAGSVCVWSGESTIPRRVVLAALASISAYSSFVVVRTFVPFALHLSFAHIMRLRLPFYIWIISLVAVSGLCGAAELFSTLSSASIQVPLILASIMLTARFFQSGSLPRLALAFSCAGGAVGISLLGILAPAVTLFLLWSMSTRMLVASDLTDWVDEPPHGVVRFFGNPLVHSRAKLMYLGCFFVFAAFAFRLVMHAAGGLPQAASAWLGGVGLDGAVFLLMTAILPLVVGLGKARETTEMIERSDFGSLLVYLAIAPFMAVFMLKPDLIPSLGDLDLHLEPNVLALASVVYAFNLLLAGLIILADIRCRDFRRVNGVRDDSLRSVMRVSYTIVTIAPLALSGYAVFLRLR